MVMVVAALVLLPIATANLPLASGAAKRNLWAVIVGIDETVSKKEEIGAADDARRMNSLLINEYNWPQENIRLLLDEINKTSDDVDKRAILDSLDWLVQVGNKQDRVLFYFSGHGAKVKDTVYLVPNKARHTSDSISDKELFQELEKLESNESIVILDSCHSGGFNLEKQGRIILTACGIDETAEVGVAYNNNGSKSYHGMFSWFLTKAFKNDCVVERAFTYAREQTSKVADEQNPIMIDGIPGDTNLGQEKDTAISTDPEPYLLYATMVILATGIITCAAIAHKLRKKVNNQPIPNSTQLPQKSSRTIHIGTDCST